MKCDELFVYCKTTCDPQGLYYSKSEVDAAIAELKVRNVMFHDEAKYYKAENEQIKAKLESVQESAYADSVDAGMRERRLQRALYKACANWAMNARMVEIEADPWGENHESRLWAGVYDKCLKKAEQYR